jgi:hypothetical protein
MRVQARKRKSFTAKFHFNVHFIDHSVRNATKEMDLIRFKRRRKIWILLVVQQAPQTEFADHTISTTPQINQQTTVHINQSIHTGRVTLSECNSSACQSIGKKKNFLSFLLVISQHFLQLYAQTPRFHPQTQLKQEDRK